MNVYMIELTEKLPIDVVETAMDNKPITVTGIPMAMFANVGIANEMMRKEMAYDRVLEILCDYDHLKSENNYQHLEEILKVVKESEKEKYGKKDDI